MYSLQVSVLYEIYCVIHVGIHTSENVKSNKDEKEYCV